MNSPSSDRNFLFALVAYQNGYITIEQFFAAAQIWNKDPKKDIGDILVERKFLDDVERFNIQGIVEDRLRRQGGIDNSLSFVVENGSVPQGEDLPEAWQEKFSQITKVSDDSVKSPVSKPTSGPSIHRYLFRRPIGEGGQGIVWEVDDTELGRRIALKKVHPKHANNPLYKGMLIEESRNTGRLDHAGIVPVYDLGQDDEGNPFFTMQLIKGEKLADRVKSIKHETLSRQEFLAKIRPLLRHLIAACNTLQYAYDQFKVIHRDLKPENIMVNRYGETVVMDWGMGKAVEDMTQLDEASSMLFVPVSGSGSGVERTQVGSVKGTLGYLSPEQAQAMNNNLDHRTDIYGLGATLYRILTGTVPYSGTSVEEALNRARLNEFVRPRERNWKIPKELEAICLKAMATLPSDRYQKATDMGMDLENWIAGEPISVVPDTLLKKSERWLRRHARGVIASLLLLGLTAAALLWATTFSLKKSYDLNIANTNLLAQQKVTKASRDALSTVLDDVVGSIFDDQMSQIPDIDKSRIKMLKAAIDEMQKFVDKYPDDWDLKLDVVRLLTRLGHLQSETDPMGASETFNRSSEFIAQAKDVPNEKIRRSNWLGSAIDSEYYRGAFLLETKKDDQAAMQANQVCFELAEELVKHEGRDEGNHGVMCRLHSQKSLILQHQDRFDEALVHADLGVEAMSGLFGGRFLQEELSKERVKEIDYADILLYMIALDQRCTVLKNLNRRSEYSNSLRDLLRCCQIAEQIPTAQRDARVYGTKTLGELYRIAISDHDASAAQRYYEQALEGIEKGIDDSSVVQVAMMFETDRATLLAPMDIDKAIEAISKAQEYLDELTPLESQTDESQKLWYMSVKIYFNDAKLAVLLAQGKQQEHEQLRQEQSELEHQFELLENKLSGKETKQ
jgi:serine/threonine protein kinase